MSNIFSVQFSPDGNHIVSGSFDGTIRVWDLGIGLRGPKVNVGWYHLDSHLP